MTRRFPWLIKLISFEVVLMTARSSKPEAWEVWFLSTSMNLFLFKPYSLIFYTTLLLGTFISVTSNNWFVVWIGLEINIYSFIPLLLQSNINQEKEAAIKYFIIQALASGLLLTASLALYSPFSSILFTISLIIKLALAPCHFWFPRIINSLSWNICWLLTTVQKVAPLYLLSQIYFHVNSIFLSFLSIISALTGAIGGLKQTQLRPILAYSSIGHLGWLTASIHTSFLILNLYFFSYIIIISTVIYFANTNFSASASPSLFFFDSSKPFLSLALLSLGGLPPLFGFFPKLLLLLNLTYTNFVFLPFVLVLSSTINLYYYLKIVFFASLQAPSFNILYTLPPSYPSIIVPLIFSTSIVLGLFLLVILL